MQKWHYHRKTPNEPVNNKLPACFFACHLFNFYQIRSIWYKIRVPLHALPKRVLKSIHQTKNQYYYG